MQREIRKIAREAGAEAVAVSFYDYETRTSWSYQGDRWFHAASTIKVAVLVALFDAVEAGRFPLDARLHVRNRFLSVVDGSPYRLEAGRDANEVVFAQRGRTMRLEELAHHMIATSSNMATNLLIDLIGIEEARRSLQRLGIEGVDLQRGVEDDKAHEQGINNRVTAQGLVGLFRLIQEEKAITAKASRAMLEILYQQAFRSGIPAGLPNSLREQAQIAHKTGEISTVAHDAGLVFLPDRKPYALAILTEWDGDASGRRAAVARLSELVFKHLTEHEGDD